MENFRLDLTDISASDAENALCAVRLVVRIDRLFDSGVQRFAECLHRRLTLAISARARPLLVVLDQPRTQISLQFFDGVVQIRSERDVVELAIDRPVEVFADAVLLRAFGFVARVIHVLHRQKELIRVVLDLDALLCASIRQDAQQDHLLLGEEGNDTVVQQVCRRHSKPTGQLADSLLAL